MRILLTSLLLVFNQSVEHHITPFLRLSEELELLARLVYAEAEGEPFEGQWAVADVVINISEQYHWSIEYTIMESGRFRSAMNRMWSVDLKDIPQSCFKAARRALRGNHILQSHILYFFNPVTATDTAWINSLPRNRSLQIGRHVFCCRPKQSI